MACEQQILELISRYVDGETSTVETSRAEAHLDTCPECKEMVQEWRHGIEMLDWTYSRALPENVTEIGFDAPAPKPEREQKRWSFPMPYLRGLAVAAVLACIAVIGFTTYQKMTTLPMLGRTITTVGEAKTVLVAKGIRLIVEPDTEINRLGDKAIGLVCGTIDAEVTHGRGFIIRTRKLEIIDEGTKFQVHSDSRTDRVTVKEGSILVREGKDEYHIGPGETLTSTGDQHHNETKLTQSGGNKMPSNSHGGVSVAIFPYLILYILFVVFWVKMFFNALRREFKDSGTKIAWVLVILFGQGLGALFYYYVVYAKDRLGRFALAGRKAGRRLILWPSILLYMALAVILMGWAFIVSSPILVRRAFGNPGVLIAADVGLAVILVPVFFRAMRLPLDKLPDLGDDPLYMALAVILMGWAFIVSSPILVRAFGNPGLLIAAAVGLAVILVPVFRAMRLPLDKLPDLDADPLAQ